MITRPALRVLAGAALCGATLTLIAVSAARADHYSTTVLQDQPLAYYRLNDSLQRANVNLRHGDPYGGSLALDQNFLWRPLASSPGHTTPVERLWQIGASTWPGPGLGAGSGTIVARKLLEPPLTQRAVARARALAGWRADTS